MRLYIKGDYTKEIPFDYLELAKRMWFEEKDGIEPDLSYAGYLDLPIEKLSIHLQLNKWMHDNRWKSVQIKEGIKYDFLSHKSEYIQLDYEDILSMSYEEANELSLEEIPFMDDVRDPVWEKDDRRNEEYIKIHGEVELDDEDDE